MKAFIPAASDWYIRSLLEMINIKKERIDSKALQIGMYVIELDRLWIDTPFPLQGFLLENKDDLSTVQSLCNHVFIDRTKSIGTHYLAEPKRDVAIRREGAVVRVKAPKGLTPEQKTPAMSKARRGEKISFLDILRDLKNLKKSSQNAAPKSELVYNVRQVSDSVAPLDFSEPYQPTTQPTPPVSQDDGSGIVSGITSILTGLFTREKFKTDYEYSEPINQEVATSDTYIIRIYHEETLVENEIANIFPVYEQSQIATRDIFDTIANEQQIDITSVSEVLDNMIESVGRTPDALLWLAKLKQTDNYAYNHALNVSINLMAFCNFMAFSKSQIKNIGMAGLLQDVGKAKLSPDILLKQGRLTQKEFEHVKEHVSESLKILSETPDIPSEVINFVACHHERINGSGYPQGLSGSDLNVASQACGLIDTYCALTSHKSYAAAMFHQQALDEIHRLVDVQFSAALVNQFIQFMGMYPVSSLVELNTGEVGVVIQQNQVRRLEPRLMLLLDQNKERYIAPIFLDLINKPLTPNGEPYKIFKSLIPNSFGLNSNDFFDG